VGVAPRPNSPTIRSGNCFEGATHIGAWLRSAALSTQLRAVHLLAASSFLSMMAISALDMNVRHSNPVR
jgi:hypothetical protein